MIGALTALAAPAQGELQRHRGRAHRPPTARARRDAALLHDRGGTGGPRRLQAGRRPDFSKFPRASREPAERPAASADCDGGARPRTLPAAIAPVLVGHRGGRRARRLPRSGAFVAALIGSIFIQIGTNLANDYSDAKRGADPEDRLGPVRVTVGRTGRPAARAGRDLARVRRRGRRRDLPGAVAGLLILAVGAASIAAGVLYTGGPRPYGYAGLGELFVFLFFGLVAVNGSYYVQLEELDWLPFALSISVGLPADRDPRRQQRPRHRHRSPRRQADARRSSRPRPNPPALPGADPRRLRFAAARRC